MITIPQPWLGLGTNLCKAWKFTLKIWNNNQILDLQEPIMLYYLKPTKTGGTLNLRAKGLGALEEDKGPG